MINSFAELTCRPCRGGEPPLDAAEIQAFKSQVSNWEIIEEEGIKKLIRSFAFKNFSEALAFVNKVGELAEVQGHHPEIEFGWGHATVTWWTHKINGLHHNDFIMAARTDKII
ncbi:MAG: 4a-hydroxytetrahydrobiopterin dehydratase [Patescibacteria group bacterium]